MADAAKPASFGVLLRQHRLSVGLTQDALAERAGPSGREIQHLEGSLGQPQRGTTRRLVDALILSPDQRREFERAATPSPRVRTAARPSVPPPVVPSAPTAPPDVPADERKRLTVLIAGVAGLTESAQ